MSASEYLHALLHSWATWLALGLAVSWVVAVEILPRHREKRQRAEEQRRGFPIDR